MRVSRQEKKVPIRRRSSSEAGMAIGVFLSSLLLIAAKVDPAETTDQ